MCGRLLKERRDLCFYSKNLAHEYLQAVLDSGYYSVCLVKLVALGCPYWICFAGAHDCLSQNYMVGVCLFVVWGVCSVLFFVCHV